MSKSNTAENKDIGFLFGITERTYLEGDEVTLVTAGCISLAVLDEETRQHWLTNLGRWVTQATGKTVAIPTAPYDGSISIGSPLEASIWRENKEPATLEVPVMTKFRILFPLNAEGEPKDDKTELAEFDPAWHERDVKYLPDVPFVSFDAKTYTLTFDTRYILRLAKPKKISPRPTSLPLDLLFPSNTVHAAGVYALGTPSAWQPNPVAGLALGLTRKYQNLEITVGLPDSPQAQSLWDYLAAGGPRMVKAHYALSARWYEDGGEATGFTTVNISQFCSDLGYAKHPKGGFRREHKQESVKILEALTAVELRAVFTKPGKKAGTESEVRLRGPLWARGIVAEERDRFTDLFGEAREGSPRDWEPSSFSFGPGPFFSDPTWRQYNKAVGKIGMGMMKLDNRNDEWAILIAGYLGTLMRAEQYGPKRLRIGTVLRQINRAQTPDAARRKGENMEKLEKALDRLVDVEVIGSWKPVLATEPDTLNMDDPDSIAEYYADDPFPKGDWRERMIEIMPPARREADNDRLQKAERKAIQAKKPKPAKTEKTLLAQ